MRKAFSDQKRLDCRGVLEVELNFECRDEIVPILRAIQHIYEQPKLRKQILDLIAQDVNRDASDELGRQGMGYWEILVLAAVRLGCNLRYDRLQDLAENHAALRHIMGIGDWRQDVDFNWRRIRDNVCLLKPATVEKISHAIVAEGHRLEPAAAEQLRQQGIIVDIAVDVPDLSTATETLLYRNVQELLRNIQEHAHATHASVTADALAESVRVRVSDNGAGFTFATHAEQLRAGHLGIELQRALITRAGGTLRIDSSPGTGTVATIELPR